MSDFSVASGMWGRLQGLIKEALTFSQLKDAAGAAGLPLERLTHLQQRQLPEKGASKSELMDAILNLLREKPDEAVTRIRHLVSYAQSKRPLMADDLQEALDETDSPASEHADGKVTTAGSMVATGNAPTEQRTVAKNGSAMREAEMGTLVEQVRNLITAGESGTVEFKQSLEYVDPATLGNTPDNQRPNVLADKQKGVLHSALKTICAFLNSKGGTLLLGVHDNGTVIGIEPDFTLCGKRQDRDGFENRLTDFLKIRIRPIPTDLDIRFVEMDGGTVCLIDAAADPMPHYLDNKLYVRLGNSTEELTGRDLEDWLKKRGQD